ncbi:MAG TPA: ActD-like protein [Polyangia bacterium]|nr:ActD-like protein [Polyangia bacterium]
MTTRKTTPDWLLEKLALGELDATASADVRRSLADEGRDADAELAALARSNQEILAALPPARIGAAVRARATAPTRRWLVIAPVLLAGAAAVVLMARPAHDGGAGKTVELEDTTIKGKTALNVYRRAADNNERLEDGARAARGDLLQLAYSAADDAEFGALVSIDGRGHVTVHWPDGDAPAAARLSHKGAIKLPSAYELDDAPAFERFFFVTSGAPFDLAPVLDAARSLAARPDAARSGALALPAPLHQLSLTLDKPRQETP